MGGGMDNTYKEKRAWQNALDNLEKMDEQALAENDEYKKLIDTHIAISILIKQQIITLNDIRKRRHEILNPYWPKHGYIANLEDIDRKLGRNVISGWTLKDLIK